jgi:hypothetical protein
MPSSACAKTLTPLKIMDNEFTDLEAELKQLRPRATSTDFESCLAQILDAPEDNISTGSRARPRAKYATATSWTSWKWTNWGVAAALVALMAVWSSLSTSPPTATVFAESPVVSALSPPDESGALRPVRAGRTLLASRVDGLVELPDGSAAQRVRDYYVDTIVWRDATGRSQLKWEVPREAVRFVGLAAY